MLSINDIFYLFWISKQENTFNNKYYQLLILLVSRAQISNQEAKHLLNNGNLEYEKRTRKEQKIISKIKGK